MDAEKKWDLGLAIVTLILAMLTCLFEIFKATGTFEPKGNLPDG